MSNWANGVNLQRYLATNSESLSKKTLWHIIVKVLFECVKSMYSDS
jgi:hypothetical protein